MCSTLRGFQFAKAEIVIIQADKERYQGYADYAYAEEDGSYSFKLIPEGRYVLQMRYDGMSSQNRPFPVMYYPGTPDKSQARVFTIKEGETIDLDIKVPPLPSEVEIRGQVVWPDGKPATTANVGYMVPKDSIFYGVKVDEAGRFSFKAYEGLTLNVSASVEVTKGKYASRQLRSNRGRRKYRADQACSAIAERVSLPDKEARRPRKDNL